MVHCALVRHPDSRGDAVRAIEATVEEHQGGLALTYTFAGVIDRVRLPAISGPKRADGLWKHTCCELFVARERGGPYREFNFAPSGEWAAYAFSSYRRQGGLRIDEAPRIRTQCTGEVFSLEARLSPGMQAPLRLGLSAVIEELDGGLSYWALRHPAGQPDFHHAESFALSLDALRH